MSLDSRRALVTGATGFVGGHLVDELLNNGYSVRALVRDERRVPAEWSGRGVEIVKGDVTDPASLDSAMQNVQVVFNIAALFREAKHSDDDYVAVNVDGVRNVIEAAIKQSVSKVVHCSTIGVHSHIPNPPADENEPYRPADIYQETKCQGEKVALEYFRQNRIHGVVIRPAMIWGPGDRRIFKLFKGIKSRTLPIIGDGQTLTHWIWVKDLVTAFRLAAEKDIASGEVFIIAGERSVTLERAYQTIADQLKVKLLPFKVPAKPIQMLGSLCEAICQPLGIEPPIYRRRVDFYTKSRAFNIEKAKGLLGYQPQQSFEEEVQQLADWYLANGWL